MYEIHIESEEFKEKRTIQQHQMVNQVSRWNFMLWEFYGNFGFQAFPIIYSSRPHAYFSCYSFTLFGCHSFSWEELCSQQWPGNAVINKVQAAIFSIWTCFLSYELIAYIFYMLPVCA